MNSGMQNCRSLPTTLKHMSKPRMRFRGPGRQCRSRRSSRRRSARSQSRTNTFNDTNHIGFIVFDEPKQQSAADFSFAALLKRAATSKANGQQVIFSTSEKPERLDAMLDGLDCACIKFDGKMLVPMPK